MATILSAAHSFPPHLAHQQDVKSFFSKTFKGRIPNLEELLTVFDHAQIDRRYFMMPLEWYLQPHTRQQANLIYQRDGLKLCIDAAQKCLEAANCPPDLIDHVIFVSSTGFATPTLDTYLIQKLGIKPSASRLPIWGLGCAAGASGISRASDYCLAHPKNRALVVSLECCSLTFLPTDLTAKNLIATAIFGDGAGAVLVAGEDAPQTLREPRPKVIATYSHLFPDSERVMGWDFREDGMELVLSPKLPAIVKRELKPLVTEFLASHRLTQVELSSYITHPGGARVIEAYRDALDLSEQDLQFTIEALREYGNVSSVSVIVVLQKSLQAHNRKKGPSLLSAFGPGFSAELLLLNG